MAKLVVQHDEDPSIGVVLEETAERDPNLSPHGWSGKCTQCGKTIHAWQQRSAIERAKKHVDRHEAVVVGSH